MLKKRPCVQNKLYTGIIKGGIIRYRFAFGGLWNLRDSGLAGCCLMRWAMTVIARERAFDMQETGPLLI